MSKDSKDKRYTQKFRKVWLTDIQLKEWIVQVDSLYMSRQFDKVCHRKNIVTSYIKVIYFVTKFNGKTGSGQRYEGSLQILQMRLSGQICGFNKSQQNK